MFINGIVVLFAVVALWRIVARYRREEIGRLELVTWSGFWVVVAIAAQFRRTADRIAQFLGVERGVDLFVYLSLFVVFFMLFKMAVRQRRQEREITKIVRKVALDETDKP